MTVTMPTWLLALTYAACICGGYAASWFGVVKIGTALHHRRRNREATTMPNRRTPWVPIIILVASAMVVTIGLMSWLNARETKQQQADERADDKAAAQAFAAEQQAYDECITRWGDDLVATITVSRGATKQYNKATEARADATAHVLRVALGLAGDPPTSDSDELVAALQAAQRADEQVRAAAAKLVETQTTNTYEPPTLACANERTD